MASNNLGNKSLSHPWFEICHPRPTAKYQVFIFPSAGQAGYLLSLDRFFMSMNHSLSLSLSS